MTKRIGLGITISREEAASALVEHVGSLGGRLTTLPGENTRKKARTNSKLNLDDTRPVPGTQRWGGGEGGGRGYERCHHLTTPSPPFLGFLCKIHFSLTSSPTMLYFVSEFSSL